MHKELTTLKVTLTTLPPQLKNIGEYILANPQDVSKSSITDLAKATGASEATISRFCKTLGFKGFQELKYQLALWATAKAPTPSAIHDQIYPQDDAATMVSKIFAAHIQGLKDTMELTNPTHIATAIATLANATHIEFWGNGGSAALALDAYHKFFKTGIPGAYHSDPHFQSMSVYTIPVGAVIFAISHSGSNRQLLDVLTLAKTRGLHIVGVSSYLNCPLSKLADITLCTPTSEIRFRSEATSSRVATLGIIDVLSVGVALQHQNKAIENLRNIRQAIASQRVQFNFS